MHNFKRNFSFNMLISLMLKKVVSSGNQVFLKEKVFSIIIEIGDEDSCRNLTYRDISNLFKDLSSNFKVTIIKNIAYCFSRGNFVDIHYSQLVFIWLSNPTSTKQKSINSISTHRSV